MDDKSRCTPENMLDSTDPGDDTQRRYWYQAAYAAIVALDLLDPETEFEEIFCEHHEDTLIRRCDGASVGVQVKTRRPGREPFKAKDAQVINSICRFIRHEVTFPGRYSRFVLATNYAFWTEKKTQQNLPYLLKLAGDSEATHRWLSNYVRRIKTDCELADDPKTERLVIQVLGKIAIQAELPKFDDVESRLARHIPNYYDAGEAGFDDLLRAARALIEEAFRAGSLQYVSAKQMYFALCSDPSQARVSHIIDGKRITRATVEGILESNLSADFLLRRREKVLVSDLPRGMRKLELKMAKGRIPAHNIHYAKDQKFSAEHLLNGWIYKYDPEKANRRYEHLTAIVGNECHEAYDTVFSVGEPFGQEMLQEIRKRLRQRHSEDPGSFFGAEYEHLLGVAGILTEVCDVWWSEEFEIPEEDVT